jgi:hypothetical protein
MIKPTNKAHQQTVRPPLRVGWPIAELGRCGNVRFGSIAGVEYRHHG